MNRCAPPALAAAVCLAAAAASLWPSPAAAQAHRPFPAQALRGELNFSAPPEVRLNGKPARLAPGARLRGETNLLLMPAAVAGQIHVVHYTVEPTTGLLMEVWLLNATERARKPWPATEAQARAWTFDPVAQTWSTR